MINNYLTLIDKKFNEKLDKKLYYIISLTIAFIYTISLFPLDYFSGQNPFWFDVRTDPTQHISGMWAFVADEWHFPLLKTTYLNYPQGVSVAFTDSIPIAALLFKPIAHFFPENSHYFGVWAFLAYIMQGISGAYFIGEASKKSFLNSLLGTLFALMMPALLIRMPHTALLMQSLLIFTLAFYYLGMTQKISPKNSIKKQSIVLFLATLIHPYFIAMLYPIYLITHFSFLLQKKIDIKYSLLQILMITVLLFLSFWIVGYIVFDKGLPPTTTGFDINSMNMLSPFLGTHLAGSLFLPSEMFKLDATGCQIDGHNYLGISVLLMIFWIVIFKTKHLLKIFYTHLPIVILMILFTIYSLSTTIYLTDKVIFTYSLPDFFNTITGTFRSSGRFFWSVGYMILFGSLLFIINNYKQKFITFLLLILLSLQYIDTKPHRDYLDEGTHRKAYYKVEHKEWSQLVKSSNRIYLFPTYGCNVDYIDPLFVQYFAASQKKQYNTGFVARIRPNCQKKETILKQEFQSGDLFIFSKNKFSKHKINKVMGVNFKYWCRKHEIGIVCKIDSTEKFWQQFDSKIFSDTI